MQKGNIYKNSIDPDETRRLIRVCAVFQDKNTLVMVDYNKRAFGPWVAHLRMTVYNGIGVHSSS